MIELTAIRVRDNLRVFLPTEIDLMTTLWSASDVALYGRELVLEAPRDDDAVNTSYYIGEPAKIPDYPAIVIAPKGFEFSGEINAAKTGFQYETQRLLVRVYFRTPERTVRPEELEIGSIRFTDCVMAVLRKRPELHNADDDTDPIARSMGISAIRYYPPWKDSEGFFRASEFLLTYKVLDSVRNRMHNMY